MKRWITAAACLLLIASGHAQKQRYSESHRPDPLLYPVTVHVTGSRIIRTPGASKVVSGQSIGTEDTVLTLHLDAVIDGKKVGLEAGASALLHAGDYQARVASSDEKKSGWFTRSYDLLFSDGTHVIFVQVAESE